VCCNSQWNVDANILEFKWCGSHIHISVFVPPQYSHFVSLICSTTHWSTYSALQDECRIHEEHCRAVWNHPNCETLSHYPYPYATSCMSANFKQTKPLISSTSIVYLRSRKRLQGLETRFRLVPARIPLIQCWDRVQEKIIISRVDWSSNGLSEEALSGWDRGCKGFSARAYINVRVTTLRGSINGRGVFYSTR